MIRRRTLFTATLGLGGLAALSARLPAQAATLRPWRRSARAFGTTLHLQVLHADERVAQAALDEALQAAQAVDAGMSLMREDSPLVRLNRDGRLAGASAELREVLAMARELSQRTAGAFDVTVQPLWQLATQARQQGRLPTAAERRAARALVDWRALQIEGDAVRLARPGMAVTLNGLAQGYAVDRTLAALRRHGIEHALLDTGEYGALGGKTEVEPGHPAEPWVLGIRHPRDEQALAARLRVQDRCVATSGDYETTFTPDHAHHHIFDPATGDSPLQLASATVLAPTGLLADGLSTAFMVLGAERALALAAQWPQVDALLIAKDGRRWATPGLPLLPQQA